MSDRRTTNFSQKGFTGNLLAFMKRLEKNELCCLDFLNQVYTENSDTVTFSGNGTQANPLIATATGGGGGPVSLIGDVIGSGNSPITTEVTGLLGLQLPSPMAGFLETTSTFIPKIPITSFGDSFTIGLDATDNNGYIQQFSAHFSETLTNLAVSGQGVWQMANNAFNGGFNANDSFVTAMTGLNDYRRSGTNAQTDNKVIGCYQSLLVTQWQNQIIDGSNTGAITWSVAPANYLGTSVGGYGNGAYTTAAQGVQSATWTFSGTNVVIGLIGNSGAVETFGTVKIFVDGVLMQTINTNDLYDDIADESYDNRRGPYAVIITGLTNTSHTVEAQGQGDGYFVLNYFATLAAPDVCDPIILCQIPHLNATGYAQVPNLGSDAIMDHGSSLIQAIVTRFAGLGYPILYFPTMTYYNVTTGISGTDNIHPSDIGHAQIFNGLVSLVNDVLSWQFNSNVVAYNQISGAGKYIFLPNNAGNNGAFFGSDADFTQLSVNRNPQELVPFIDTSKCFAQLSLVGETTDGEMWFYTNNIPGADNTVPQMILFGTGNLVVGHATGSDPLDNGSAWLQTGIGTATKAPFNLGGGVGVLLTTPVNGTLETDGTNLYFTVGGVRKTVTLT